jgi:hypothetical protein
LEHGQQPFSNIADRGLSGRNRLQSSDEVSQKACGVVIPFVQRQPGSANLRFEALATGDPFANQRGFTKSGGGRDEGQFASKTLVLA